MILKGTPEKYGTLWGRDELILTLELYCRIPFRTCTTKNPAVIELAAMLDRSPAAVARKLGNFGSFDPSLQKRQISGLTHVGKLDKMIWDEFSNDWNRLALEAERLRDEYARSPLSEAERVDDYQIPQGPTEREVLRKTRIHQRFFRDAVLSSYESTCCITGLPIRECLVASHIIPWSIAEPLRTDPRNGLCLSATFDRLFDRGLITISNDMCVNVATTLMSAEDKQIKEMICAYHGKQIIHPRRFLPLQSYLEWHHNHVYQD